MAQLTFYVETLSCLGAWHDTGEQITLYGILSHFFISAFKCLQSDDRRRKVNAPFLGLNFLSNVLCGCTLNKTVKDKRPVLMFVSMEKKVNYSLSLGLFVFGLQILSVACFESVTQS